MIIAFYNYISFCFNTHLYLFRDVYKSDDKKQIIFLKANTSCNVKSKLLFIWWYKWAHCLCPIVGLFGIVSGSKSCKRRICQREDSLPLSDASLFTIATIVKHRSNNEATNSRNRNTSMEMYKNCSNIYWHDVQSRLWEKRAVNSRLIRWGSL